MSISESRREKVVELFHQMGKPERVNAVGYHAEGENRRGDGDMYWLFNLMSHSIEYKVWELKQEKENLDEEVLNGREPWSKRWNVNPSEITDEYCYGDNIIGQTKVYGWHPVFSLLQHFRSNDSYERGYTDNNHRGDHVSIPIYSEHGGEIYVMDISFHKGVMSWEIVGFPRRPVAVKEELYEILSGAETR